MERYGGPGKLKEAERDRKMETETEMEAETLKGIMRDTEPRGRQANTMSPGGLRVGNVTTAVVGVSC